MQTAVGLRVVGLQKVVRLPTVVGPQVVVAGGTIQTAVVLQVVVGPQTVGDYKPL